MTQEDRNDAIMVRISEAQDDGDPKPVCAYFTTAINETLKMFITAKENKIKCYFNECNDVVPKEYSHVEFYVRDVHIYFGDEEYLTFIEVVIT